MVLADLGNRIHTALNQLSKASVVDEKVHIGRLRGFPFWLAQR
jgi:hypothetical protein